MLSCPSGVMQGESAAARSTGGQRPIYGKDRGYESFAPITSNAAYQADKDTMFGFYGSVGLFDQTKGTIGRLQEVDYKTGDVKVEIDVYNNKASAPHYQGHIIDLKQAFAK